MMDPAAQYRPDYDAALELLAVLPPEPHAVSLRDIARDLIPPNNFDNRQQRLNTLIDRLGKRGIFISRYKDGIAHGRIAVRRDCWEKAFDAAWKYVSQIEAAQ
jgi:hypothetical protein